MDSWDGRQVNGLPIGGIIDGYPRINDDQEIGYRSLKDPLGSTMKSRGRINPDVVLIFGPKALRSELKFYATLGFRHGWES